MYKMVRAIYLQEEQLSIRNVGAVIGNGLPLSKHFYFHFYQN